MLLTLTPNPAVDRTLITPGFRSAEVCRITKTHDAAGGKGLNVVRVARTLGTPVRSCGLLAGAVGQKIAVLAAEEGLEAEWTWLQTGESRTCLIVIDPDAPDTLVLNERGPQTNGSDWEAFATLVFRMADAATAVACSGSLPPGVEAAQLVALLAQLSANRQVFLDTSGAALTSALDLPLALLKINAHELGEALGTSIDTPDAARQAAAQVCVRGPKAVIVTLGKDGAVAVDREGAWWARPPHVELISPVASGDALLAGVATGLLNRQSLAEALCLGVACGAANTLTIGGGIVHLTDVKQIRATTVLTEKF